METKKTLFTAKVKPAGTKKTEKILIDYPDLDEKIYQFLEIKNKIDSYTAEMKMIEADIKAAGKTIFLREYITSKVKPDSFKIKDKTGSQCLFICMDKYTAVNEEKAEVLRNFDLLDENYTYKINPDLVEKYGEILNDLILGCEDISEDDKANLISGEIAYSVKKGAIDRLIQYENPGEVFELINPITALKK